VEAEINNPQLGSHSPKSDAYMVCREGSKKSVRLFHSIVKKNRVAPLTPWSPDPPRHDSEERAEGDAA
jgi:hypothetical protein